ncbi:MAG: signal peptidase II [Pseudomonadota bacterium]
MRLLFAVAVAAFCIDQGSKVAVMYGMALLDRGVIDIWPPFLRFVMAWNRGVNFGVLASGSDIMRWALVTVSVAVSVGLVIWARRKSDRWFMAGAGLVVGGALGNALDRVIYGAVADFLNMSCCGLNNPYVFNVADIAIFAGAMILILLSGDEKKPAASA